MAVLPAKNAGASQPASSARFRQRKISVKVALPIFKQADLNYADTDLEHSQVHHLNQSASQQQRDLHSIETGVDKNEEDEVHLQQVINAAQKALLGSQKKQESKDSDKKQQNQQQQQQQNDPSVYIPTPDASKIWPDAHKYYNDPTFIQPDTYIKFSATVEDTIGVEYNMDEEDEEFFLNVLSKQYPKSINVKQEKNKYSNKQSQNQDVNTRKCSELEFEIICDRFEKTIEEKQPFLSVDPSNILSYDEITSYILEEFNSSSEISNSYVQLGSNLKYISTTTLKEKLSKNLNYEPFVTLFDKNPLEETSPTNSKNRPIPVLFDLFGKPIYEHWKTRKIIRKGKPIHASLKFEDPNASEKDNDNDPYICFRRREFRQARKTRRADTLGAERIRLLQKSLHRARNLVTNVCQREIIKLETYEREHQIFKLRSEAKSIKRAVGVKGDDYLFYPHKRKKIVKPKIEEEDKEVSSIPGTKIKGNKRSKLDTNRDTNSVSTNKDKYSNGHANNNQAHQQAQAQQQAHQLQAHQQQVRQESTSSTQPYVKLPPSKIPDMDLVTVSKVLKEKNETIKRAVLEKLRKRKDQDKGFINVTDDPFQPFFNISTNDTNKNIELTHIPYSSIAASSYHQINTTNFIDDQLKKLLEDDKHPLPGIKTFRGSNGELIPSKSFPQLLTLSPNYMDNNKSASVSYVAQLLSNIEANDFIAYSNGYGQQQRQQQLQHESHSTNDHQESSQTTGDQQLLQQLTRSSSDDDTHLSDPVFRLRKRVGRANRSFVDRRGLVERPNDVIDEFLKFDDDIDEEDSMDVDSEESKVPNVYDCKRDTIRRLDSNWRFDNDFTENQKSIKDPFSLDPSKLNCISDDTQSIRFGSMLLSKSYDLLRESVHQRQILIQQARMRAIQQQQQLHQQQQQIANKNSVQSSHPSQLLSSTPTNTLTVQQVQQVQQVTQTPQLIQTGSNIQNSPTAAIAQNAQTVQSKNQHPQFNAVPSSVSTSNTIPNKSTVVKEENAFTNDVPVSHQD